MLLSVLAFIVAWLIELASSLFHRECDLILPNNYSASIPPIILDEDGNQVPLSVEIHSKWTEIEFVNDQTGRIGIWLIFDIEWHDPNIFALEENRNCFGKFPLEDFRAKFWTPPLIYQNVRKTTNSFQIENLQYGAVTQDQKIVISQVMDDEINCKFDFRRYPFDQHHCQYRITSWFDNNEALALRTIKLPQSDGQLQQSIQNYGILVEPIMNGSSGHFYQTIVTPHRNLSVTGLNIHLRRTLKPYLSRYFGPSSGLVGLAMVSFFIPAEMVAGRMAFLVTLYLTVGNLSLSVNAQAPPVKDFLALNLWGYFLNLTFSMICCEYALILYLRFQVQKKVQVFDSRGLETELQRFRIWTTKMDLQAALGCSTFFVVTSVIYFSYFLL